MNHSMSILDIALGVLLADGFLYSGRLLLHWYTRRRRNAQFDRRMRDLKREGFNAEVDSYRAGMRQ